MMLEDAGVSAITVHGRSGEKKFGEPVNYRSVREVVEAVGVPVVGNGGVFSAADAVTMVELTGVDGVMPGRGLIGNPWIVEEINSGFNGEHFAGPSLETRKAVCLRHLGYLVDYVGETDGVVSMRRVLPRYFSGAVHASDLRKEMVTMSSVSDAHRVLDRITQSGDSIYYSK